MTYPTILTRNASVSLTNYSLTQHVTEPTHQRGHTLDWLVTSDDNLVANTSVSSVLPSDHLAILATLTLPPPTRNKHLVARRSIKRGDRRQFTDDAVRILSDVPPAALVDHFNTSLSNLLDKHAPAKTRLLPPRPPSPWLTPKIIVAKRRRRQAE